ncbi:aldehyde dehydrogenase [Allopusillimonas ginsengisoli]|uniref:aldehyde dehydrogenase n=1 Tax=Allopusillimonas ginsengisoli TaxID=453575 RepID=UPI001FD69628|nr:aldehyde dehydrogenase [Allopusillimonas ginsengisoli]
MTPDIDLQEKLYIDGAWQRPQNGGVLESIDPSTGKPWTGFAVAGPADINAAVDAANAALRGPWSRFSPAQRANLLRRIGALFENQGEQLAVIESRDNGQLLSDMRNVMRGLAEYWYYYAGIADKLEGRTIPMEDGVLAYTTRVPVGVVGAIVPWNAPLQMVTWKLAPALATGCTMVLKSAEETPVSAYFFARLIEDIGIPPGVVNIVSGLGATAGRHLVAHPGVNKISFTGEHRTAQDIMRGASVNLKRLSFECGGKAPHIIFDDASLPQAMNAATHNAFAYCGQSCALGSRLLVQRGVYEQVVQELARRAERIRVGLPDDPRAQMGPQNSEAQLEKTLGYVDIGKSEGARLLAGGRRLIAPEFANGYFVAPTVFADASNDMRVAQEEIFGPVVCVIPFDTEDEAVEIANHTDYGLTAGLWSQDIGRAHRVAARIEAGTVWVNTYRYVRWAIPYGGFKLSGLGRENGQEGVDAYLQTRSTIINLNGQYPDAYAN